MVSRTLIALTAFGLLTGCATAPQVVRTGDPGFATGKTLALAPSAADPLNRDLQSDAAALVLQRLGAERGGDTATADYLLQVTFATLPRGMGIRDGEAWVFDATRHRPWQRSGVAYALSLAAIEARTGKVVYAVTAAQTSRGDPAPAVGRLVDAAFPKP